MAILLLKIYWKKGKFFMQSDSNNFEDWFTKAENDLRAGQGILYYYEEPPTDTVCYHAHQTVEKSLKGYLIFKTSSIPWVHDLVELVKDHRLRRWLPAIPLLP